MLTDNGSCIVEVSTLRLWPIELGDLLDSLAIEIYTQSARLVTASQLIPLQSKLRQRSTSQQAFEWKGFMGST